MSHKTKREIKFLWGYPNLTQNYAHEIYYNIRTDFNKKMDKEI